MKPNVLPGVRVCKTSMINNLISKEEACCGKAPPEVYPHSKSRQERSINGTTGTVGPWVLSTYWYRRSIGTIDGGCHYKKLSTLEIHI